MRENPAKRNTPAIRPILPSPKTTSCFHEKYNDHPKINALTNSYPSPEVVNQKAIAINNPKTRPNHNP